MTKAQKSARNTSVFLLVVFALIYSSCAEVTTLACSRPGGTCELSQRTLLRKRQRTFKDIRGAYVVWQRPTGGRGSGTGHTMLITSQGLVQFEVWGGNDLTDVTSPIQEFVKDPKRAELNVVHDTRLRIFGWASFLLIGALLLFGISFIEGVTTTGDHR